MPKVSTKLSRILILILVVAVAARLAWVLLVPTEPVSDFLAFDHLAKSLVSGTGFSMGGGEPTTYRLPGYPFFLASLYAVTGQSWLTARLANVALGVLTCLLTYAIASRLFNRRVALIAALLVALFPSHILYANILATENLFIPLVLALLLALTLSNQDQKLHTKWLTLAGILLGLGALTRPALLLFPIVWGGLLLLQRLPFRRVFAALVVIGLVAVAIILPWTVRNALVTGEFIPIASEGGITFLAGHNQMALTGPYSLKSPEFDELYSEPRSEAETDAYAYQLAFRFIRQNPGTELKLLVHKFRTFSKMMCLVLAGMRPWR